MQPYKILVVDDELSVRTALEGWFLEDGFKVDTAESAEETLKKIQPGSYDLILLDIKMSGMDGITLQKKIKDIDPPSLKSKILIAAIIHTFLPEFL